MRQTVKSIDSSVVTNANKHITITDSHNGSSNKQKVSNNRTTALERKQPKPPWGGAA